MFERAWLCTCLGARVDPSDSTLLPHVFSLPAPRPATQHATLCLLHGSRNAVRLISPWQCAAHPWLKAFLSGIVRRAADHLRGGSLAVRVRLGPRGVCGTLDACVCMPCACGSECLVHLFALHVSLCAFLCMCLSHPCLPGSLLPSLKAQQQRHGGRRERAAAAAAAAAAADGGRSLGGSQLGGRERGGARQARGDGLSPWQL